MKANLTKKVGPLPLWAYAVILGGAFLAFRLLRGNKSEGSDASVQLIPTGAPPIEPSAGFLNELSMRLERIESSVSSAVSSVVSSPPPTTTTPPPPASSDGHSDGTIQPVKVLIPYEQLGDYVIGLRARFPTLHQAWIKATGLLPGTPGVYPNETAEQREARLRAEALFLEKGKLPVISATGAFQN